MKLCNIKVSASFKEPFYEKQKINKKVKQKVKNYTFIHYMHSPHSVNITGIRSRKEIEDAIQTLEKNNKKVKQKVRNFTFIRYLHSPHLVNITGIRSRK